MTRISRKLMVGTLAGLVALSAAAAAFAAPAVPPSMYQGVNPLCGFIQAPDGSWTPARDCTKSD
jgi:hypothetical protein